MNAIEEFFRKHQAQIVVSEQRKDDKLVPVLKPMTESTQPIESSADLTNCEEILPENLGLTSIRSRLASLGLPVSEEYLRAFRIKALTARMRSIDSEVKICDVAKAMTGVSK